MTNPHNTRRPTSHIAPFGVRMPPDLKERLERVASASDRSLNAEIVQRLERSLEADEKSGAAPAATLGKAIDLAPDPRLAQMLADLIAQHIDKKFDVQIKSPDEIALTAKAKMVTPKERSAKGKAGAGATDTSSTPAPARRMKIRRD